VILAVLGWILLRLSQFFDFEACWCLYISLYRCLYCDSLWFSVTCRYGVAEARQIFGGNAYTRSGLGEKVWFIGSLDVRWVRWAIDELDELDEPWLKPWLKPWLTMMNHD
jgi:hypothetical protein